MAEIYSLRLKAAALENLKQAREDVRQKLGTTQVGARLEALDAAAAGELANSLLALLDCVDGVVSRAKPAQ